VSSDVGIEAAPTGGATYTHTAGRHSLKRDVAREACSLAAGFPWRSLDCAAAWGKGARALSPQTMFLFFASNALKHAQWGVVRTQTKGKSPKCSSDNRKRADHDRLFIALGLSLHSPAK
jgi:hypothetical protein